MIVSFIYDCAYFTETISVATHRFKWKERNSLEKKITSKILKNEKDWISITDLEQAYSQLELDEDTSKHCVLPLNGRKLNGYNRCQKRLCGLNEKLTFLFSVEKKFERKIFNSVVGVLYLPSPENNHDAESSSLQDRWCLVYYMCRVTLRLGKEVGGGESECRCRP